MSTLHDQTGAADVCDDRRALPIGRGDGASHALSASLERYRGATSLIAAGPMSRMTRSAGLLVYRWEMGVEIQRHGPEGATLCPSLHRSRGD
jgi:hypothetical protein